MRDKSRIILTLGATLVTDPSKNIMIEVKFGDTLSYLQVVIGDQMKVSYPDQFDGLDNLRAFNITIERNKQRQFAEGDVIDDSFQDGDRIFFELNSTQIWLRVKFILYERTQFTASKEVNPFE